MAQANGNCALMGTVARPSGGVWRDLAIYEMASSLGRKPQENDATKTPKSPEGATEGRSEGHSLSQIQAILFENRGCLRERSAGRKIS